MTTTTKRRAPATVAAPAGEPFDEAIALTRRLRLPYLRMALTDVVPTARAQRWDPAELVRVLLAEEAAGRDEATMRARRRRAGFPAGKTFEAWDQSASSIPRPTQQASAPGVGHPPRERVHLRAERHPVALRTPLIGVDRTVQPGRVRPGYAGPS